MKNYRIRDEFMNNWLPDLIREGMFALFRYSTDYAGKQVDAHLERKKQREQVALLKEVVNEVLDERGL